MSRVCEFTGTGPTVGNNVSHSKVSTKKVWRPNLQYKRFTLPSLKKTFQLTLSTRALRMITKAGGLTEALKQHKHESVLSARLQSVRKELMKHKS